MVLNKKLPELLENEEIQPLTDELIAYRERVFANRFDRATQNQRFVERVFGENYSRTYSYLRKLEMHFLNDLTKGISSFIDTIHGDNVIVADMLRMYYGLAKDYELPMSVNEIAKAMDLSPEFVEDEIKRGHRMLRHPSRRYLFANHRQLDQYKEFQRELSNFIEKQGLLLFDQFDEISDLRPAFTIENRYEVADRNVDDEMDDYEPSEIDLAFFDEGDTVLSDNDIFDENIIGVEREPQV